MTGVEALSNVVQASREPVLESARKALTIIIGILVILLAGPPFSQTFITSERRHPASRVTRACYRKSRARSLEMAHFIT